MANPGNTHLSRYLGQWKVQKPPPDAASLNRDTFIFTVCIAGGVLPVLLGTKGQTLLLQVAPRQYLSCGLVPNKAA